MEWSSKTGGLTPPRHAGVEAPGTARAQKLGAKTALRGSKRACSASTLPKLLRKSISPKIISVGQLRSCPLGHQELRVNRDLVTRANGASDRFPPVTPKEPARPAICAGILRASVRVVMISCKESGLPCGQRVFAQRTLPALLASRGNRAR